MAVDDLHSKEHIFIQVMHLSVCFGFHIYAQQKKW
ncbi:hypothetical protein C7431_104190 [Pantoea allii]|uniref:Uncharacterized protein n=1 Tax=Pantoea allii TaxID=574096 RepID=A0A2V2BHL7_9GAMM|nr:hypothetical protein C7431_104190 [Pantoea allii]